MGNIGPILAKQYCLIKYKLFSAFKFIKHGFPIISFLGVLISTVEQNIAQYWPSIGKLFPINYLFFFITFTSPLKVTFSFDFSKSVDSGILGFSIYFVFTRASTLFKLSNPTGILKFAKLEEERASVTNLAVLSCFNVLALFRIFPSCTFDTDPTRESGTYK